MQELPLNEDQLKNATKNFWGIRYKYDSKGRFTAYANALTVFRDAFRKLFKPHKCYHIFESYGGSCIRCGKTTDALLIEKREEIIKKKEKYDDFWQSQMLLLIILALSVIAFTILALSVIAFKIFFYYIIYN
jgi:hypothetical protein